MSDALLCSDIESWLREHAMSHAQAKPRRLLLDYLRGQGHSLPPGDPDSFMRKFCRRNPDLVGKIGSCPRGYFWITNAEDRRIALAQLDHPAKAMLVREKRIRDADTGAQGELFT